MENLQEILKEIQEGHKQESASQKDEIKVMKAMLNDREYTVDVYGNTGVIDTFSPAKEARQMLTSAISATTKISTAEAEKLSEDYEFTKKDSVNMLNITKEFVSIYPKTGRKLPLGGREESNISICGKRVEASVKSYPYRVGTDAEGKPITEIRTTDPIPAYDSLRISSPCPNWLKNKEDK